MNKRIKLSAARSSGIQVKHFVEIQWNAAKIDCFRQATICILSYKILIPILQPALVNINQTSRELDLQREAVTMTKGHKYSQLSRDASKHYKQQHKPQVLQRVNQMAFCRTPQRLATLSLLYWHTYKTKGFFPLKFQNNIR